GHPRLLYYPVVEDVDARDPPPLAWRASVGMSPPKRFSAKADKRGHDDPMKSGLAVHRFRAAPRPGNVPGIFLSFMCPRTTTVQARSCFKNSDLRARRRAAGGRKPVRTIQASVRTASGANSGPQAFRYERFTDLATPA